MNDLIEQLKLRAGISNEQAVQVIDTVKDYVKAKFPMLAGAVDKLFEGSSSQDDPLD